MYFLKIYLETHKRIKLQRRARIRTRSDWIRTDANFGWIRTGLDCNFFENWRTGLDRTEKIFVVLMWLFWTYQKF